VTGVTVTPQSAVLTTGGTQQITATAQAASGITASLTYGTTNPAVANVSASGLITAVGPGTATITVTASSAGNNLFAAATATGTVGVIVNAPAQISVASITLPNGQAVDISNVTGQITVAANLATNGNNVSSVQLFACAVSATGCPAAGQTPIAQQTFGAAGASSGTISFLVNTAAFTVAPDFSSATTNFPNGQTNIVATITSGTGSSSANANLAVLNVNNADGFAARHTAPTNSALDANNDLWYGGPGAAGRGSVVFVPVIYTPGRSVASATIGMGGAGCTGTFAFTSASARPWTISYGQSLGSTTLNTAGLNIPCNGNTAAAATPDVVPAITAAIDNNNATFPTAFRASANTTVAVAIPAAIRGDWAAPVASSASYAFLASSSNQSVAAGNTWVGNAYNFVDGNGSLTAGVNFSATEPGVGLTTTPILDVLGCGSTSWTRLTTNTGADLSECPTDLSPTAYTIRYSPADRLGNAQVWTSATGTNPAPPAASASFGVDKTAPFIRYTASTDASGTTYATITTDTVFSAEAIDDRAGLFTAGYSVARANNAASANRAGACLVGSAPTAGIGASFISAPSCSFAGTVTFGTPLADGYRMLTTPHHTVADLNGAGGQGYYTFNARVFDRAGNVAALTPRNTLINNTVGTITPVAPATFLSATSGLTITGSTVGSVEVAGHGLEVQYNSFAFRFPYVATSRLAFDDVALASSDAFSLTLPFTSGTTFYTNIEQTTAGNAPGGTVEVPTNVRVFGENFAGFGDFSSTASFSGSLVSGDAVTWSSATKSATAIQTFAAVDSTAAFNAPAGGLKARLTTGVAQAFSPFARVDFYAVSGGAYQYLGSVNGQAAPCTSGTCEVYISDNGVTKSWTYVLRSAANDIAGNPQRWRGTAEVTALNTATPAPAVPFAATQIVAVGVGTNTVAGVSTPAGRALLSQVITLP
jgi:hypothetical protein